MVQERHEAIDFLRGLAIILMIFIHATAYFLNQQTVKLLWDYTHFAVPLFVFCSAYLYFKGNKRSLNFTQLISRLKRLLVPYYLFLGTLYGYTLFIKKDAISQESLLNKVLFFNAKSADFEWLIVLFIYFIFLFPLISFLSKKPIILWIYGVITFFSSVYLLTMKTPLPYRFIFWLPWSFFLIAVFVFTKFEKKYFYVLSSIIILGILFFVTRFVLISQQHSLIFTSNKYPPNLYYLSFGLFWCFLIYAVYPKLVISSKIKQYIFFLSKYSYSVFFIHFLIIFISRDVIPFRQFTWWGFFIFVLVLSSLIQLTLNTMQSRITAFQH